MNVYIEFGKRLATIRQNKKISQTDVANKLGIAQTTYSGYENGTRKIPLELIEKLASIFDVSPTYLVTGNHPIHDSDSITKDEIVIINTFRNLTPAGQNFVLESLDLARMKYGLHSVDGSENVDKRKNA